MASPSTLPGGLTTDFNRLSYADTVAALTGLDPRVVFAWQSAEGHPGDEPGYSNYMNIQSATANSLGIPITGTGPAGTVMLSNIGVGEKAAVAEIKSLGLGSEKGKTPAQQISDIAASPWASSHYGGPGGPNLQADFSNIFGAAALGGPPQTGSAGTSVAGSVAGAVTAPISSVTDALGSAFTFLFSYRFLEILGGGALILVGLYILAQQLKSSALGQAVPLPGATKEAVTATGLTPEVRERREARAEETHQVRLKTEQARATELRTRTKHRRRPKQEQDREVNRAYIRGAAETSPLQ